jgi:hypothetical protein
VHIGEIADLPLFKLVSWNIPGRYHFAARGAAMAQRNSGGEGLFGLGTAVTAGPDSVLPPGPLSKPPTEPEVHREALVKALRAWQPRPRRGAPVKDWRKQLRAPIVAVMRQYPEFSNAQIARVLFDGWDEKSLRRTAGIANIQTIQNWLSEIRRGRQGYGRKQRPIAP